MNEPDGKNLCEKKLFSKIGLYSEEDYKMDVKIAKEEKKVRKRDTNKDYTPFIKYLLEQKNRGIKTFTITIEEIDKIMQTIPDNSLPPTAWTEQPYWNTNYKKTWARGGYTAKARKPGGELDQNIRFTLIEEIDNDINESGDDDFEVVVDLTNLTTPEQSELSENKTDRDNNHLLRKRETPISYEQSDFSEQNRNDSSQIKIRTYGDLNGTYRVISYYGKLKEVTTKQSNAMYLTVGFKKIPVNFVEDEGIYIAQQNFYPYQNELLDHNRTFELQNKFK